MHRDNDGWMQKRIKAAFDDGCLTGKCPTHFPSCYFCLILEFMDHGSAQELSDKRMLRLEGLAAITRQVASALAFMHQRKRTHNDVKPENILLQQSPTDRHLLVKLADLGLAEHSTDRTRDHDLLAYTIWCLVLGRRFGQCPTGERRETAVEELRGAASEQHDGALATTLAKLVQGLWRAKTSVAEVQGAAELQGHQALTGRGAAGAEAAPRAAGGASARRATHLPRGSMGMPHARAICHVNPSGHFPTHPYGSVESTARQVQAWSSTPNALHA